MSVILFLLGITVLWVSFKSQHALASSLCLLAGIVLMALATAPAHAADRCHDKAGMYQMAYSLRDTLTDKQILTQTAAFNFSEAERQVAIYRVKRDGELGFMSLATLYKHVLLECRGVA